MQFKISGSINLLLKSNDFQKDGNYWYNIESNINGLKISLGRNEVIGKFSLTFKDTGEIANSSIINKVKALLAKYDIGIDLTTLKINRDSYLRNIERQNREIALFE